MFSCPADTPHGRTRSSAGHCLRRSHRFAVQALSSLQTCGAQTTGPPPSPRRAEQVIHPDEGHCTTAYGADAARSRVLRPRTEEVDKPWSSSSIASAPTCPFEWHLRWLDHLLGRTAARCRFPRYQAEGDKLVLADADLNLADETRDRFRSSRVPEMEPVVVTGSLARRDLSVRLCGGAKRQPSTSPRRVPCPRSFPSIRASSTQRSTYR